MHSPLFNPMMLNGPPSWQGIMSSNMHLIDDDPFQLPRMQYCNQSGFMELPFQDSAPEIQRRNLGEANNDYGSNDELIKSPIQVIDRIRSPYNTTQSNQSY